MVVGYLEVSRYKVGIYQSLAENCFINLSNMKSYLPLIALAGAAAAQSPVWGQCGGIGWTGPTTCVAGTTCTYQNDWYYQCLPSSSSTTKSTTTTTKTTTTPVKTTTTSSGTTMRTTTSSRTTTTSSKTTTTSSKTTTTSTKTTTSSTTSTSPTGSATWRFVGRVNPATKELSWPGSGLAFSFKGTTASISISSMWGDTSVTIFIDGVSTVIPSVTGTSIAIGPLASGVHTVQLRKRTDAYYGSLYIGDVTTDGSFVASAPSSRRIEIVGDSISVGYGLDGVNPCSNTPQVEDTPLTYGALAAGLLGAEYSVVAWSGKGVLRNYQDDGQPLMPELYTRYGGNDADNTYTYPAASAPQAIVIALGTNDFGYLGARNPINVSAYTAAVVSFGQTLQSHYPGVSIFLLSSPMLSDSYPTTADAQHTTQSNALKSAAATLGSKAYFVDWPTQGSNVGCDYHPNAATHAAEAPVLAAAIKSALGW
ncbi:hypothetical protein H072_11454 [Dactylellina haptotyla CBS 200.50]|uniref:CBM1 domain-containing protein n=1 Tax=Dactylellina haptotyla (strain CBS 200.50) TaxID=1284197 RepID=S8B827_DACHA|nr:hypothetical protein H072_11454 [Dactylellina haptotyla CBS 200.50]